jgi:hypothetical protein
MYELVVKHAFSIYQIGSVITDPAVVDYISEHPHLSRNVVRRFADAPAPAPAPAPEAPADDAN